MNYTSIISILTFMSVISIGGSLMMYRVMRRAPLKARLDDMDGGAAKGGSQAGQAKDSGMGLTDVIGNIGKSLSKKGPSASLSEQLTQAGYHHENAAAVYIGVKLMLLIIGILGAAAIFVPIPMNGRTKALIIFGIGGILFLIPNMVVGYRRSERRSEITRHLPDAIDLLEICASAGMGLDMAWNAVTDEIREVSAILADEMALTNLEIHLGAPRTDAMRHMARRTGAEELSSLVAVLVQSERFGTSVSESLQHFATYMRETRSQRAQESAEKMSVKLIFPMVGFIFPAVVLVMAGPAFIQLYGALRVR